MATSVLPFDDFEEPFVRGDTHRFRFTVKLIPEGTTIPQVQPIGDWKKFWCYCKRRVKDLDADAVLTLTDVPGEGISRVDEDNGLCEIEITPIMTEEIASSSRDLILFTDIQGKDKDDNIYTLSRGKLILAGDIVRTRV